MWLAAGAAATLALLGRPEAVQAQPSVVGTDVYAGSYTTYNLTDLGAFRQYRNQASSSAGANGREWQFTQGTAATPDYSNKWMPYNNASTRYQIAGYNQLIAPNTAFPPTTGTATYAGSAGWPGGLPAVTSGNYYTFNITESAPTANNTMAVLETAYNPVAISSVSTPTAPAYGQTATVTATTAATPNAAEYLWLRYSTDNFATSTLVLMTGSGTSWSATVPGLVNGTVVRYYVLSSPLNSGVTSANADMLTLNLNNNGGANYSYTVAATLCGTYTVNPSGGGLPNFTTMGAAFSALNAQGVSCAAVLNVKDGVTFAEQNIQLNTISGASATNTITFQRDNSTGTKPRVQPASGFATGGTLDAIIKLSGTDFVTFDGIDVAENPANTGANMMEFGYALFHASATNGCQDNQLRNCAITLDKTNTNTTVGLYSAATDISGSNQLPTSAAGANSRNRFNGNTITNAVKAIQMDGNTSNANLDLNNEIGSTTGNTMTNIGPSSGTAQVYGVQINGQSGVKIENNSLAINTAVTGSNNIRGISTGVNATAAFAGTVTINNNTVTITNTGATSGNVFGIQHAATNNVTGVTITNNTIQNCSLVNTGTVSFIEDQSTGSVTVVLNGNRILNNTAATAALVYGINRSGTTSTSVTIGTTGTGNGNTIQNTTLTAAGAQFRGILVANQAANTPVSFTNNLIDNTQQTGTGAPNFQGITVGTGAATLTANTITNNAITSATGATAITWYGFTSGNLTNATTLTSNVITANSVVGPNPITMWALYAWGTGVASMAQNVVGNLTAGTTSSTAAVDVRGLVLGNGTNSNAASRNKVYNLTANGSNATVAGINPFGGIGATTATNNLIGGLAAPQSNNTAAVTGIRLENGWTGAFDNVFYNTVYLTGTSTGTNFGTSGIYVLATSITPNLRNNLIVNLTTPTGTGYAAAYRNFSGTQGTAPTNLNAASNNNLYYCGVPMPRKVIYLEGTSTITNVMPTLAAYQSLLSTREQNSLTGPVTFSSTTGTATDFLHFVASSTQPVEGTAGTGTGVTVDFDNDTRDATTPDIGADEVTLTTVDLTPPRINLNAVVTTPNATLTAPTISNVTITDASGVDVAAGTRPRLYYKLSTDPDTYNGNTSATTGWKFVEASNASSPFSFTMDYSLLPVAITGNQTIQYFVTAQDLAATPNVGISVTTTGANVHNVFAATPASVALTTAAFPLGGVPLSYYMYIPFSGTVSVGAGQTYTSLTRAGGLFEAMNNGALVGNLTIQITSDITNEDGTFELRPMVEFPSGSNYTITMQSDAATERLISGAITGGIRFNGIDRVTIDGRVGGSGKFLRFRNTLATASAISILQDANFITIRECYIEGAQTVSTGVLYLGGSTTAAVNGVAGGVTGNSNFQLLNCELSGRTDNGAIPQILFASSATAWDVLNTDVTISGNNFVNFVQHAFVANNSFGSRWTISNNSFYATVPIPVTSGGQSQSVIVVYPAPTATQVLVDGNFIGGTAPGATGGMMTNTASTTAVNGWRGIRYYASTVTSNVTTLSNNVIRNISVTQTNFRGIEVQAGIASTYIISGNTISNISCGGTNGTGPTGPQMTGIYSASTNATAGLQTITGNTITGLTLTNTGTNDLWVEGIWVNGAGSAGTITRNRIYGFTSANGQANSGLMGIHVNAGSWSVRNNQIALTNGTNTNAQRIAGLYDNSVSGQTSTYYFNTVYIGGTAASGTSGSWAFSRPAAGVSTCTMRNNIFMNARTGGTGDHNAIFINNATAFTSNNNALFATNAATVGNRQGTNYTLAGWRTATSQDAASVNVGARFVDLSTGNLNLDGTTNCSLDGAGAVVSGVNGEFDNAATSRATTPDIGSDEFTYTQQTATLTTTGSLCAPVTGSVTLSGNGGPWSVVYSINGTNQSPATASASPFTFSTAAGSTYALVSVTDAYGCTLTPAGSTLTVEAQPTFGTAKTDVTCNGAADGTITVTAAGGTGSYQFSRNNGTTWVSGASPFTFSGLAPGAYQVKVRNATGGQCEAAAGATTINITEPTAISATTTPTMTTCPGGNDGQLTVNASGGTGSLEYSINSTTTYQTSNVFAGLSAVNYTIRVRDANGCVFVLPGQNPGSPTAFSVSATPTASTVCVGGTTSVTVTASGGTGTLQYSIDNGVSFQSSNVFTGVTSGTKLVRVRDANNCVSSATSVVISTTTTTTWTGAVNSDWYNAGNWDYCVPGSGINAVIPTGSTPNIGAGTAAAKDLDLQGSAVLTVTGTGNLDVYGAFTTATGTSFQPSVGTTHFRGTAAQAIPAANYVNLTLTGSTAKVLGGTVRVNGTLNLTSGMLRLDNFDLTLADNQTITGYGNAHFVVTDGTGRLTYESVGGGETVTFPIGTSTAASNYTPARLTNNGTADDFSAAVTDTIPQGPIVQPGGPHVVKKTWEITEAVAGGSNASLTLGWNVANEGTNLVRTLVAVSHFTGGVWDHPFVGWAPAVAGTFGATWQISRNGITSFSPFAVQDANMPLPVELTRFAAERRGNDAELRWETASERNSQGFEVQVSTDQSRGALAWRALGFVKSETPNSNTARQYRFLDTEKGKTGVRYYRLKQVDLDGRVSYSGTRVLTFGPMSQPTLAAWPNPFAATVTVELVAPRAGVAELRLVDALGRLVLNQAVTLTAGVQQVPLVLPEALPAGTYFLTTTVEGRPLRTPLVKQ